MKTIYNSIKAICIIALLSMPAVVVAQEEQSVSRELTLEREYDPSVQDANKVNTLPAVKEPEVRKMPIDYSTFTVPTEPQREIGLLPSGSIMTDMKYNKRRGYLNFGAGTLLNINGDAGYHILSTDRDQLNLFFSHRSTNGNIKFIQDHIDAKTKAKLNENLGGLNYRHVSDKSAFKIGANYGRSSFNYYGLPGYLFPTVTPSPGIESENSETPVFDNDTNQVNQTINAYIGVESVPDAPVGYLFNVDYINFGQKYSNMIDADGVTEHTIQALFDLHATFGGAQKVGLGAKIDYFNYKVPNILIGDIGQELSDNRFIGTLSPYYKVEGENWNIKLGVNASFITKEDKKFVASPNIAADVAVGNKTVLYLTAEGGPEVNSYYELSRKNRYVALYGTPATSRTWLDALAGVKSGVAPGFWFDIFAGYKITDDDCFFLPVTMTQFGNTSSIILLDSKRFLVGVNLKYAYQKLFEINLKGVYNNWNIEDTDNWLIEDPTPEFKAYGRPEMEITAGLKVNPIERLSLQADYYLGTGRYTSMWMRGHSDPLKMKNINELNVTGSYTFNDTFGIYAKVNNLLFQKYEMLYGYPLQGFSIMGGININF